MNSRFLPLIKVFGSQRRNIFQMFLGLLMVKTSMISIPILIGWGVDAIAFSSKAAGENHSHQVMQAWIGYLSQMLSIHEVFLISGALLLLSLFLTALTPWQQRMQTKLVQAVVFDVTMDWIERIFKKDLGFFKEKNAARTANILSRGIHGHEKLMNQMINVLLPVLIEVLLASFVLIQIGGVAALIFIFSSVLAQTFLTLWIIRHRRKFISDLNDIEDESAEMTQELLSKGLIFQIYNATSGAIGKLSRIYRNYADQCVKISYSGAHLSWLPFQFQTLGSIVALIMGFYLAQSQQHSLGQVLVLISFFTRFSSAASECVGSFRILDQFRLDVQEAEKILSFQDFSRVGARIPALNSVKLAQGTLIREGVSLFVPQDIEFSRGDQVALVGVSGCGKSTLLDVLAGLDEDSRQALFWNGIQLSDLSSEEQLRTLRFTPQDPMVFSGTFSENIFQRGWIDADLVSSLAVEHLRNEHRGEISIKSLSGGEAKRVALVRALSSTGGLYLMDEPTAGLNEDLRQKAWDLIQNRTQDGILVTVTHDEDKLDRFNKILTVENGVVKLRKWQISENYARSF